MLIDGLQYCNWSEKIFRELRNSNVTAIHVTVSYHEQFRETVSNFEQWNRWFEKYPSLIMPAYFAEDIEKPKKLNNIFEYFFGEDQGRYVLEIDQLKINEVKNLLNKNNIYFEIVGKTQKSVFELQNEIKISVNDLYKLNKEWYYKYHAN